MDKINMKKTLRCLLIGILTIFCFDTLAFSGDISTNETHVPATGMVTMIDLGAKKCIPCKMMAPILVKLEKAYQGKAAIVFIDVWENKEPAKRFGIRGIPTQIFFDKNGKEVYRHTGFLDEEAIIGQLTKMGVAAPEEKSKG